MVVIILTIVIPSEARDLQLNGERRYYVCIMASRSLNLYTGVTDNIFRRALEHKSGRIEGFTKKYRISRLLCYEAFKYIGNAIAREKQIKAWTRAKRLALIKTLNPTWQDLADGWGEKIKLQIPRSSRDDNSGRSEADGKDPKEAQIKSEEQPLTFTTEDPKGETRPATLFPHRNLTVKE
jgi:putative endonuclease